MTKPPAAPVEHLIAGLHAQGAPRFPGVFTLDREKARDKMRQFQLANPHRYVLELVQAAVAKGATRIRFDIDADDMRMRFDGRPFSLADFEILYNALFTRIERPDAEAVAQLALGCNTAMALHPRWIRVCSGAGGQGAILEMRPGRDDTYEAAAVDRPGTEIHVKARFRPGLAVTFVRNLQGTLPEEELLRARCGYCRIPIDLEGTVLSRGVERPELVAQVPVQGEGLRGVLGYLPTATTSASVDLVKHGVWIATHPLHGVSADVRAVVECDALRKDVSQLDIVQDETYAAVGKALRRAHRQSLAEVARWVRQRHDGEALTRFPPHWGEVLCHQALSRIPPAALRSEDPESVGYHLARVPLFPTLTGERLDLVTLLEMAEGKGAVGWTPHAYLDHEGDAELDRAALCADGPVLHLPSATDREVLTRILGPRFVSVTRKLNRRIKAVQNRRLWRLRPAHPRLADRVDRDLLLAVQPVSSEAATGEVGLVRGAGPAVLYLIVDGHALCRVQADLPVPGLVVVLEAPLRPNRMFDGVRRDAAFAGALSEALAVLTPLLDRLASQTYVDALGPLEQQRMARAYLVHGIRDAFPREVLQAFRAKPAKSAAALKGPAQLRQRLAPDTLTAAPEADVPPLARLALFRGVGEAWFSLLDLARWRAAGEPVRWVDRSLPRVAAPAEPILWLEEAERRALATLLGEEALQDATDHWQRCLDEAEFMAQPARSPRLQERDDLAPPWRARFTGEGLVGELGLTYPAASGFAGLWPVRWLWRHRLLVDQSVDLVLPPGRAVVDAEALTPAPGFEDLVPDEPYRRAVAVVREAAGVLVAWLATHLQQVGAPRLPSVEALLRAALDAWVPTRSLGRAFLALRDAFDPERADTEYQGLHRLLAHTELIFVDAAVGDLLEAKAVPTASAVGARIGLEPAAMQAPPVEVDVSLSAARFAEAVPGPDRQAPFAALRRAPLFRDDEGVACTLDALLQDFDAHGEVLFVERDAPREAVAERRILRESAGSPAVLRHLFGHEALVNGRSMLEAAQRRKQFSARATTDAVTVHEGAVVLKRPVEAAGMTGEVGLSASPGRDSVLHLYLRHRHLATRRKFTRANLVAAVNDDRLNPSQDYRDVESDGAYLRVVEACEAQVPALLDDLAARLEAAGSRPTPVEREHVLDFLTALPQKLEPALRQGDPRAARLAALPLLPGMDGHDRSLQQLLQATRDHGEVVYLPERYDGEVRDPTRQLIVTGGRTLRLLRRLFPKVSDYSGRWEQDQLAARIEASGAPELPSPEQPSSLVQVRCDLGRFRGVLRLPWDPEEPRVLRLGACGRELARVPASDDFPCAGVFELPADVAMQPADEITLDDEQRQALEREALGLYRRLANLLPRLAQEERRERARSLLYAVLKRLIQRERDGQELPSRCHKLRNQLTYLPLISVEGRLTNLDVVQRQRPAALAGQGLWEAEAAPVPEAAREAAPVPEAAPALPSVPPRPLSAEDIVPPTVVEPPPPPPEKGVLDALRAELEAIAGGSHDVLQHVDLRGITYGRGRRDTAVLCEESGLVLNRRHPLVREVLEARGGDPQLVTYLASAVYTAVNIQLEEVTDDDERTFTRLLAEHVCRRCCPGSPHADGSERG